MPSPSPQFMGLNLFEALDYYAAPFREAGHKWDSPRNGTNVMELLVLGGTANMTVLLVGLFSILVYHMDYVNFMAKWVFRLWCRPLDFLALVMPVVLMVAHLNRPAQQMQVLCFVVLMIIAFVRNLSPNDAKRKEYETNYIVHCQVIYAVRKCL